MKLCVIIPVFNEEDFIEKSINSIISQSVKPDKVVYVNDSSTDNTKKIIRDLSDDYDWIEIIDQIKRRAYAWKKSN